MEVEDLARQVHERLRARAETVASAESLTGGSLGDLLSGTPGASATYRGGVISYATEVKQQLLGVTDEVVRTHGVVSGPCAEQMALGARGLLGSDWALSTTGVAGPDAQDGLPAGTVFVGVAGPAGVEVLALRLDGDRAQVRRSACRAALGGLLDLVGHAY